MFRLECKKCKRISQDSYYDKTLDEVICSECGEPIDDVPETTKRALIGIGKVINSQPKTSYMIECKACWKTSVPKLKDNELYCSDCGEKLVLTDFFKKVAIEHLKVEASKKKK